MLFQKGQSGNPSGRPRGSRNRATILFQNLLEDDAEAIARKAVDMAKAGDIAAIRICMDRLAPARRTDAIAFELPPSSGRPTPWRLLLRSWPPSASATSRRRKRSTWRR